MNGCLRLRDLKILAILGPEEHVHSEIGRFLPGPGALIKLRKSISLKITVLVLCGASAVFALALAYSYAYSRRMILAQAEKSATSLTLSVARRIEQEFRAAGEVPKALAAVPGN